MIGSKTIKKQFLNFFESKGHTVVPSAPIVVKGDPTLMFTNAGMNQFKDYFLGNSTAPYKRAADTQKCLRVSGKHNDLEEVGHDHYHHTMFEMLGNWSFGDYFKEEAIAWAWELLTEVYQLPKDRLYVTVFEGDTKENLAFDQEAYNCWKKWIPEERILKGNKKDNFWEMGETGPCGPCTEIHYDGRSESERKLTDGAQFVNADHADVIEIWNNVFMEFNRKSDGSLEKLPSQHVDTGMGFERLTRIIQDKNSNYDTDIFQYIIQETENICAKKYRTNESSDIAFRVIADHIRAVALCIADGQLPSNTGAGYVVRRILRRAVRYGYSYLAIEEPFLFKLIPSVAGYFADVFPELLKQAEFVARVIKEEEASFFRTLSNGIGILNQYFIENENKVLAGKTAFELYDTFGFPIDLTQLICREKNVHVDIEGFEICLQQQKQRSKADAQKETGDWIFVGSPSDEIFDGYDHTELDTSLSRYRTVMVKNKAQFQLVLAATPFYAESGGQVGDTGVLIADGEEIEVLDCQKENKLHIHIVNKLPRNLNAVVKAKVNLNKRKLTEANHSATHLLHAALRKVLGDHVAQKGSFVNEEYLRFDFSHFSKLTTQEIIAVENLVNIKIREAIPLTERRNVPYKEAMNLGAMALFGEKYGDYVRVITFDKNYSTELCGGTHIANTSAIGLFKITAESSVAAGVRRIEAVTSEAGLKLLNHLQSQLTIVEEMLNHPKELPVAVDRLLKENMQMRQKLEHFEKQQLQGIKNQLIQKVNRGDNRNTLFEKLKLPSAEAAKDLCFQLKAAVDNLYCVIAFDVDGKPGIAVVVSDSLVQDQNMDAALIVRELGKEIQGGGGGQKFFATAGGKYLPGLDAALTKARGF